MKNQDKPCVPCMMQKIGDNTYRAVKDNDPKEFNIPCEGLTKYEEFMKVAMGALIESGQHGTPSDLVEFAHDYVQAMFSKIDEHKEREG